MGKFVPYGNRILISIGVEVLYAKWILCSWVAYTVYIVSVAVLSDTMKN